MVLCLVIARYPRPPGLHADVGHRAARGAEGDAAAHRARRLGKADVIGRFGDGRAVGAPVLHRHLVFVEDAWQRCVVGVHQIVLVARRAVERHPRLVVFLCTTALHDVGLGGGVALLVHMPLQLHRAGIGTFRCVERVEQGSGADGLSVTWL